MLTFASSGGQQLRREHRRLQKPAASPDPVGLRYVPPQLLCSLPPSVPPRTCARATKLVSSASVPNSHVNTRLLGLFLIQIVAQSSIFS